MQQARDATEKLQQAGHEVVHQEMLDAYPPSVRLHFWPKPGPLDKGERARATLEFVWGDPVQDALCARRWTAEGLDRLQQQGSARPGAIDEAWTRDQLFTFVRDTLEGV
jgi:hypothetical protein